MKDRERRKRQYAPVKAANKRAREEKRKEKEEKIVLRIDCRKVFERLYILKLMDLLEEEMSKVKMTRFYRWKMAWSDQMGYSSNTFKFSDDFITPHNCKGQGHS